MTFIDGAKITKHHNCVSTASSKVNATGQSSRWLEEQVTVRCRRRTRATRSVTPIVLLVDVQCDEMATAVGRTKLTALTTIYVPWQKSRKKSVKFKVWDKVIEGSTLITGPLTHDVGSQYCRRRLSSSVTLHICNVTHQGAARDGGQ